MQKKHQILLTVLPLLVVSILMIILKNEKAKESVKFLEISNMHDQNDDISIFVNYNPCNRYTHYLINYINNYDGDKKVSIHTNMSTSVFLQGLMCASCKVKIYENNQFNEIIKDHDMVIVFQNNKEYIVDSKINSTDEIARLF